MPSCLSIREMALYRKKSIHSFGKVSKLHRREIILLLFMLWRKFSYNNKPKMNTVSLTYALIVLESERCINSEDYSHGHFLWVANLSTNEITKHYYVHLIKL